MTGSRVVAIPAEEAQMLRELGQVARTVRGTTPLDDPARKASELLSQILADLHEGGASYRSLDDAMGACPGTARARLSRHGYLSYVMGSPYRRIHRIPSRPQRPGPQSDLTGLRFHKLIAVKATGESHRLGALWLFRCDCGAQQIAPGPQVKAGRVKACQKCSVGPGRARLDLAGQRFHKLTAIEPTGSSGQGGLLWRFRCDCGAERVAVGAVVKRGGVRSCIQCSPGSARRRRPSTAT